MSLMNKCIILFSGGTDSLCAAALMAEQYSEIHLLTFYEESTKDSVLPRENVRKLKEKFSNVVFRHFSISTDKIVKKISYESYLKNVFKFGFYNLCTTGISSLSWHIRAIAHAQKHDIVDVFDGMTQELVHLPGHNPKVRVLFSELYNKFGLNFSSPVLLWETPPDQRYVDRLIVDQHGFSSSLELVKKKTTGNYVYQIGLLPHPNVKGSLFDQRMQHDCYPFVVYNIFVFWWAYFLYGEELHNVKLVKYMKNKINFSEKLIKSKDFDLIEAEVELK